MGNRKVSKAHSGVLDYYDPSQEALNNFIKANPIGTEVNGGPEEQYKLDVRQIGTKLKDLKLFKDVDR